MDWATMYGRFTSTSPKAAYLEDCRFLACYTSSSKGVVWLLVETWSAQPPAFCGPIKLLL
jgi:hypothetical protein